MLKFKVASRDKFKMELKKEELLTAVKDAVSEILSAKAEDEVKKEVEKTAEEKVNKVEKENKIAVGIKEDKSEIAQKEADGKNWNSFGEFLTKVHQYRLGYASLPDNRLVFIDKSGNPTFPTKDVPQDAASVQKVMTEGTDSAGGFLVPEEYRMEVQMLMLEKSVIRPNGATRFPMKTDTLNIPRVDDTSHTASVFGGVIAYWTEEVGTKQASEPQWGNCKLTAHELSGVAVAGNNLLADNATALEAFIKRAFAEAWAYYEDDAFINGTGVGQPLGILNSGALISVTRQANTNVRWVDFTNMWGRMLTTSRDNAIWLMNQELETQYLQMVSENAAPVATAGTTIIVDPKMGGTKSPPTKILGRPYFVTEKMAALGSAGDLGLFDLSYYIIGDRSKLAIDASTHVFFTTNKTAWRFTLRVDGQPWLQAPLTPKNGTNTVGPFIALSSTS